VITTSIFKVSLARRLVPTPPDQAKQALFPPGHVPNRISSAGFATIRIELDPNRLDGTASTYMTNVVEGNLVQGPFYMDGALTLDHK